MGPHYDTINGHLTAIQDFPAFGVLTHENCDLLIFYSVQGGMVLVSYKYREDMTELVPLEYLLDDKWLRTDR